MRLKPAQKSVHCPQIYPLTVICNFNLFLPPGCALLFEVAVVDGVGGVKVRAVLSQHLREDNVALEPKYRVVRIPLDEDPVQVGVGVQVNHKVQRVFLLILNSCFVVF